MHRHALSAFALALSTLAIPALAQPKPVTLRWTSGAPPKTPWVAQIERMQKYVEEESKGTLRSRPSSPRNWATSRTPSSRPRVDASTWAASRLARWR